MMQSSPNGSSSEESSLNITIIFLPADFASSIYGVASECPYLNGNRTKSQSSIEVSLICCFASANKSFDIDFSFHIEFNSSHNFFTISEVISLWFPT